MDRLLVCCAIGVVSLSLTACTWNGPVAVKTTPNNAPVVATSPAEVATGLSSPEVGQAKPPAAVPPPSTPVSALHTPQAGTAERKAILDAIRVPVQKKLGQAIVFKVNHIAVKSGWAFVTGEPLRPNGKVPDYSKTPYAQALKDGFFDNNFSALLRLKNGAWTVVAVDVGATDVVWVPWPKDYGALTAIFPKL